MIDATHPERLFEAALDGSEDGIVCVGSDGRIGYVNSAFEEMTGYSSEEVLGRKPRILNSGAHDEEFYRDLWETILSGAVWERKLINKRKHGRRQYVDQTIAPVRMDDDTIDHFVAINTEITEQHRQQQQLQVFYRVLRHNLRNELNSIRGYAEQLGASGDGESAALGEISETVEKRLQISQQATKLEGTFSKEGANEQLQSLTAVVEGALQDVSFPESAVTTSVPQTRYQVNATLQTAVAELVTNAIKHTDSPEPTVSVTVTTTVDHGVRGRITVADDGPGIPTNERQVLREDEETPLLHGSGLDLWLVNWIVTELGGEIDIRDNEPTGSAVTVPLTDRGA